MSSNEQSFEKWIKPAYILSTGLYIAFYIYFLNWITSDMMDYMSWTEQIVNHGLVAIKAYPFDYTPASMLIFILSSLLPFTSYLNIKLIALPFIPISALLISDLIFKFNHDKAAACLGYALTCLLPTILVNTALWGQTDIYYGLALLLAIYFFILKRPYAAVIAWGIALCFKAPPLFLGPFLLFLFVRKQIPWKALWIPPALFLFFASIFISLGTPTASALGIFITQEASFHSLCMNCATLWSFLPAADYNLGVLVGFGLAFLGAMIYLYIMLKKIDLADPAQIVLAALLSMILMPFLLPKMHDRYFFFAELLSVSLIFLDWRFLLSFVLLQISTGIGSWHYLMHDSSTLSMSLSAGLNLVVLLLLFWVVFRPAKSITLPSSGNQA